jgi:hypothetical protein
MGSKPPLTTIILIFNTSKPLTGINYTVTM